MPAPVKLYFAICALLILMMAAFLFGFEVGDPRP